VVDAQSIAQLALRAKASSQSCMPHAGRESVQHLGWCRQSGCSFGDNVAWSGRFGITAIVDSKALDIIRRVVDSARMQRTIEDLAAISGIPISAVYGWRRRGVVPHKYRITLLAAALERNIDLPPIAFEQFGLVRPRSVHKASPVVDTRKDVDNASLGKREMCAKTHKESDLSTDGTSNNVAGEQLTSSDA
jgi:hypothetical protein